MFPAHAAATEKAKEKTPKYEKVPGTEIQHLKGGVTVRVAIKSGLQFAPEDTEAAKAHVASIKGENAGKDRGESQQKWGNWEAWVAWAKGKGWGKGAPKQQPVSKKAKKAAIRAKKQAKYDAMTPEEIEARRAKNKEREAKKIAEEQRVLVDNKFYAGEVVARYQSSAWVKPKNPAQIPAKVQTKLKAMNDELRAKAKDSPKGFLSGKVEDNVNVIYVRLTDIVAEKLVLKPGVAIQFQLYTDTKGVGACEVKAA